MALTKCAECKKEISHSAKVCPHCGRKDPTLSGNAKVLINLLTFVFIISSFLGVYLFLVKPAIDEINNEPGESGFVKGLKLGLLPITIPLKLISPEKEVDPEIQELQDMAAPPSQKAFHKYNGAFTIKYERASNEIQKSAVFNECNKFRGLAINELGIKCAGWVGRLTDISTDQGGDVAYISVRSTVNYFEIEYKTMNNRFSDMDVNSMLKKGTRIYNKVGQLNEGDFVLVEFSFILDNERGIKETSVTEKGCVFAPEFIVRFSAIEKLDIEQAKHLRAFYQSKGKP